MLSVEDNNSISELVQPTKKVYVVTSRKTTLNDDFDKMEVKVKNIRELYMALIKYTIQFFKESKPNEKFINKLDSKKTAYDALCQGFTKTGYSFGKDSTVGQVLISLGEIERELGDNSIKFEQEIKRTWIKKLEQYINVDINNANHIKRNLEKHIQQYDNARTKLRKLKNKNPTGKNLRKIEQEEMKAITERFKFNRLALSCDYKYRMICNETQDAILVDIMNFVRLQKKLHQDNVSKLDAIMKKIIKSHKTNRWNAIRDNKIGIQAYVRKNYKARNMDEVNLKVGQKVIIINQETELKNYWEVIVGGKNGLVPKDCIVFERGIAIFNYESKNEDELNFLVGDEITILNKETGEFGWYQGFNKGSIGFFPSNYIKLIHLDFIPPEDSIIDESFLYSHQRSEFSNSLPLEYNLPKNEQNPNSYIHKRTNIPEEINTSISSNPQEPSKPNMSNYGFSSNMYSNNYLETLNQNKNVNNNNNNNKSINMKNNDNNNNKSSDNNNDYNIIINNESNNKNKNNNITSMNINHDNKINENEEILRNLVNIQNETASLNFNATINSLQTDIYSIIKRLNKSIEDVIIEEYKIPGLVNKNFNSTDNTIFLPKDISNKDNVELKKRQGMICDENITTTIDNDKIDKYYRNISGSSLKAHANDVEEVNGYIEEFEKGNNPNNSILDIQKVADTNQININNVRLDDIIDEKDIIDNKINIEVVLLRYIEKFVDNARELIDIDHYTSDHVFILRNCIDYLNKIADSTQVMVFTIKCKQTKSKLLMACKNVASSLAAVINSSKISCSAMYQQSQELINCLTHFIELINMNSGRYKEEVWNNVKSQIEEDRITLHSSIISNPKEEKISLHNYNNINHKSIYHFDDNLTVPNIHTNNSNANSKNPILEEILQNEFEILNSQVKEINADDDDNDDDDPSSEDASKTLDRLFSIMNSKSNLTIKSSSLNNKNKKVVCKDKNKNNNKINDHDNNKDINKKVKVVSSSINKLCSKNEIGEKNDKKLNDDKKNKIKVNHCTTSNSPLRNDSIRNEKKFQLNYKVISPHSKEALKNKIKSPNLDNSDDDSENYDISQIINSYSDINIDSIGINDNNDSNTTTGINGGSNKKNNNIQLEHILSPKCQFSEIKSNEIEIFNSNKNVIVSEINDFKDLNNSVDFSIEETRESPGIDESENSILNNSSISNQSIASKNLYKALNIVNLVKKDVDFLLKNYSGDANSSLCDEYTLKKIEALLQIIIEIRKTLILAISRQQEITDRVLINLDGNTSFTDEEEWNNSFAKNGMILADIVSKIHQHIYKLLPEAINTNANKKNNNNISNNNNFNNTSTSNIDNNNNNNINNSNKAISNSDSNNGNSDNNSQLNSQKSPVNKSKINYDYLINLLYDSNENNNNEDEISSYSNASSNPSVNLKYYKKFNLDNINNLLYQNNIAGNSKLNINGLNNKKSSNNNKTNSSDNNNIINNNNTIGNIVNPIDEIYNIELQSKKKDKKLVNTKSIPSPLRSNSINNINGNIDSSNSSRNNLNSSVQHKVASININIPETSSKHNRSYSVFDKKIVNPVKNRRYSLNSVNDYISKFNMTNTSPSMKSFNPLTYSPSNNILLNNNNNNINTISNNSKNTNLNTNLNLLSTTQTQTSFKPTLNIEYPSQNRDIFNDLINSLKTPIKNLIVSSELKNDFPSIIHDQLFNQYEKILTKNQNFTQIKS